MIDPKVKINGFPAAPDQFVAAGFEMFTITDVSKTADLTNKYVLDAVLQQISMVCAPIVLGAVDVSGANGVLHIAVDRKGVVVPATLQAAIQALAANSVAITFSYDANTGAATAATYANMGGITVTAFTL